MGQEKNSKLNYPQKNVGLTHGFKKNHVWGNDAMFVPNKIKNNITVGHKNNLIWGRCCNLPT